jgi:hypothetical protein
MPVEKTACGSRMAVLHRSIASGMAGWNEIRPLLFDILES